MKQKVFFDFCIMILLVAIIFSLVFGITQKRSGCATEEVVPDTVIVHDTIVVYQQL